MRSRTLDIHFSLSGDPVPFASFQQLEAIKLILYDKFT